MDFYGFAKALVTGFYRLVFRVQVEGAENVPAQGPFVVCANHRANLDPPLLGVCLPVRLRYMAKEELFRNKLLGSLIRALGAFPIRRGKSDVGALRAALRMLEQGESVAVFPEGGRSSEGHMRRGKPGAALIAAKAGAPILPVGIGEYRPFRKMQVRIGKPIAVAGLLGPAPDTAALQKITDAEIMPAIAELAGVKTYAHRDS